MSTKEAPPQRCGGCASLRTTEGCWLLVVQALLVVIVCTIKGAGMTFELALPVPLAGIHKVDPTLPKMQVHIRISDNAISVVSGTGFASRSLSVGRLVRLAFDKHLKGTIPGKAADFIVHTGDNFDAGANLSFAVPTQFSHRCFPSFMFDAWPEVGVPDYEALITEMQEAGSRPATHNQAVWLGAPTHNTRRKSVRWGRLHPDLARFELIIWNKTATGIRHESTAHYISMPQQASEYSVLVDLRGAGFSARLPALLASGRPVIIQARTNEQWFIWDTNFQPWTHYIPLDEDVSDIGDVVEWAVNHPKQAAAIGRAGAVYASTYLTKEAVLQRIADIMRSLLH
jgi:hypothetical protein